MGRKRKKSKAPDAERKKPMEDPDPNSEDYIFDKVDKFHQHEDKILLDPSKEKEESDLEEDLDEEVLALEGVTSSDEDDDEELSKKDSIVDDDNSISSGEDTEEGLPNDKAWGQNKKAFYDADVDDEVVYASDEEAEIAAAEEEEEAMILQKRLAGQLNMDDFYTFDETVHQEETVKENKVTVTKDLSKLTKKEKLELLAKESPELLPLLDEYKEKLNEVKEKYHPLMLMARKGLITNPEGVKFIEMKHQLLLNYLVNISFYLALKASKNNTKGHPVIGVLVQHQKLISEMKPLDEKLAPEIEEFLAKHRDGIKEPFAAIKSTDSHEKGLIKDEMGKKTLKRHKPDALMDSDLDPLKYYNLVKAQHDNRKIAKKQKLCDPDDEEEIINESEENGKRMITYEMSKNKGLIRKRRKELKNPRVKHKMKFQKAKVKRKGQVRELQREINRYGGETTGIKSSLTRSTKIK